MQIPIETLRKWETLRSTDDTSKIAEKANCTLQAIRNVFSTGKASDDVFIVMSKYFNEKMELIKEFM